MPHHAGDPIPVAAEIVSRRAMRRERSIGDLSAVVTGLLLAFNLPPALPSWMAAAGALVAIVIAKQLYGGLGYNPFNPALIGRVFLLISFPVAMTTWSGWQIPVPAAGVDALTTATPQQQVAAVRAAAGDGEGELAIQPLRDPKVEDLRAKVERLESQQYYAEAARTLDQALEIVPDDPALLQERAEAALLLGEHAQAEALARRAYATGSQVGPLCRRHWATIEQSRLLEGDAAGAATAKAQIEQCTVAGVNRF